MKMQVVYSSYAKEDREYWQKYRPQLTQRIDDLIADIVRHPFTGIGKPEALRFKWQGYWSRRIDHQHRLVYKVVDQTVYIVQCRYHYEQSKN